MTEAPGSGHPSDHEPSIRSEAVSTPICNALAVSLKPPEVFASRSRPSADLGLEDRTCKSETSTGSGKCFTESLEPFEEHTTSCKTTASLESLAPTDLCSIWRFDPKPDPTTELKISRPSPSQHNQEPSLFRCSQCQPEPPAPLQGTSRSSPSLPSSLVSSAPRILFPSSYAISLCYALLLLFVVLLDPILQTLTIPFTSIVLSSSPTTSTPRFLPSTRVPSLFSLLLCSSSASPHLQALTIPHKTLSARPASLPSTGVNKSMIQGPDCEDLKGILGDSRDSSDLVTQKPRSRPRHLQESRDPLIKDCASPSLSQCNFAVFPLIWRPLTTPSQSSPPSGNLDPLAPVTTSSSPPSSFPAVNGLKLSHKTSAPHSAPFSSSEISNLALSSSHHEDLEDITTDSSTSEDVITKRSCSTPQCLREPRDLLERRRAKLEHDLAAPLFTSAGLSSSSSPPSEFNVPDLKISSPAPSKHFGKRLAPTCRDQPVTRFPSLHYIEDTPTIDSSSALYLSSWSRALVLPHDKSSSSYYGSISSEAHNLKVFIAIPPDSNRDPVADSSWRSLFLWLGQHAQQSGGPSNNGFDVFNSRIHPSRFLVPNSFTLIRTCRGLERFVWHTSIECPASCEDLCDEAKTIGDPSEDFSQRVFPLNPPFSWPAHDITGSLCDVVERPSSSSFTLGAEDSFTSCAHCVGFSSASPEDRYLSKFSKSLHPSLQESNKPGRPFNKFFNTAED